MSETTDKTAMPENGDRHMSEDTQSSQANDGTEVEFTIPQLLNNMATALHQLLAPHGQSFFVMVVGQPKDEDGTVDLNTISSITPVALPRMLREQADAIEQNQMVRSTSPEEIAEALSGLDADPEAAANEVIEDKDKPASS